MRIVILLSCAAIVACSNDSAQETPAPDPVTSQATGVGGGATSTSATGAGGSQTGSGGSENPGFTSGTRLRARIVTGADGSKLFAGFFDSQMNQNCSYAFAVDSKWRCLPENPPATFTNNYADSQCTQPAAAIYSGCPKPAYVRLSPTNVTSAVCGTKFAVRPVQQAITTVYNGTQCNPQAASNTYALGPEVDPTMFVEGTETTE